MSSRTMPTGPSTILHVGRRSAFVEFALRGFAEHAAGRQALLVTEAPADEPADRFDDVPIIGFGGTIRSVARLRGLIRASGTIVVHSLTPLAAVVILLARRDSVILWSGWGDDYYGGFWDAHAGLIGEKTRAAVVRRRPWIDRTATTIKRGWHSALRQVAARRVDFFSAPIATDVAEMTQRYPLFRGRYLQINYADLRDGRAPRTAVSVDMTLDGPSTKTLLLGNSASPTNNLLEALDELSQVDLTGWSVIAPLGYGHPGYRKAVIDAGRSLLGQTFIPLVDFVPIDEYLDIVGRCSVVIMNHRRQQAVGNVIQAISEGSCVVFDPANPLYRFCRDLGLSVFSLQDVTIHGLLSAPPAIDHAEQRARLLDIWGDEKVGENFRQAVHVLDSTRRGRWS